MTIPVAGVDVPFNLTTPLAASLDLATGLGRVVHDMLTELIAQRHSVGQCHFDAVCDRIVELLCMLAVGDNRPDAPRHLAEVEAMIRRYARKHVADPDLTGASIAHALGWSLRHIQHALQQAGTTPRDLIREERLQLVKQRLHDPAYQHMSITDVAHASGFSSISALNSQYRQHYGILPSKTPAGKNPDDYNRDDGLVPPCARHASGK